MCGLYIRKLLAQKKESSKDYTSTLKSLTPRQKQIIQLFEENLTADQMANSLKFSPSTIMQDNIKIYNIFGVNSRVAVVELAMRAKLT